jgi:hypothetical protein
MLAVVASLFPKQEKSPQPMSSMRIMTMLGRRGAAAASAATEKFSRQTNAASEGRNRGDDFIKLFKLPAEEIFEEQVYLSAFNPLNLT